MTLSEAVWIAKNEGKHSSIRCPAHDDRSPSLSVSCGFDQPVILKCHSGCTVPNILAAGGLVMADIAAKTQNRPNRDPIFISKKPQGSELEKITPETKAALLTTYKLDLHAFFRASPNDLVGIPEPELWKTFIKTLYAPDDIIWTGGKYDSGDAKHKANFRACSEWLEGSVPAGPLVSLSTFKKGSISRGIGSIDQQKFFVVESDTTPINEQGAVIRFCQDHAELKAVVHSGNRSLHAWFERPSEKVMKEICWIFPQLDIDRNGLINPSQPFRLPGFQRQDSENYTGLLWLAKGYAK